MGNDVYEEVVAIQMRYLSRSRLISIILASFVVSTFTLPGAVFPIGIGIVLSLIVAWSWKTKKPTGSEYASYRRLILSSNPSDCGQLVDLLTVYSRCYGEIVATLIRLLPSVNEQHIDLFTKERILVLERLLRYSQFRLTRSYVPPDLLVAILRVFEYAGTERQLDIIARIASKESHVGARDAASRCHSIVAERVNKAREGESLLRAARSQDALLRPEVRSPPNLQLMLRATIQPKLPRSEATISTIQAQGSESDVGSD